jgi:hypothetical protein
MKTFAVHPHSDSDHTLRIAAASPREAALVYLTRYPVRKNLVVSSGAFSEVTVTISELIAAYPDVEKLLRSAPSQEPPPELARAFAAEKMRKENSFGARYFRRVALKLAIVFTAALVAVLMNPGIALPEKFAIGAVVLSLAALVWWFFRRRKAR